MVPVDLSDRNERALRAALALAREAGSRVTLFHVHCKAGAGFRVRKTAEDCRAPHVEVKVTEDGKIQPGLSRE